MNKSPGKLFREAVESEKPLKLPGTINAYAAMLAERVGFKAIYLSGSGVATASYGLPDLGMTGLADVLEDVRRITGACSLPLLVDANTGWGNALGIARTVRETERTGAAGIHIEDQVSAKRCGHRPGKEIVPLGEMVDRIKAAVDARDNPDFVIMARTDAFATEGLDAAIERAIACREAGADMIFPEALTELEHFKKFAEAVEVPVLANITEFGRTPLFTAKELGDAGVSIVLYPLSAFRAMARAAERVYEAILRDGTQKDVLELMQTREELYEVIGYHDYERKMDEFLGRQGRD
ncbi:MAG: methylisocitrate lyase [candidate division WOR-3 bacterium]